ncbi:hypothetical protein [Desulfuromonas thiophila]|uniref:Cyanophycin synthetase n=1 Tax=Desulfuromonas thiophila TaxID=57664 RepID=A0A1G7EWK2_9BACT|nr:hypothetical protein [Desulfuromonas thiophila]SDE68073.1 cyanophycin synthetase [Desulfuromonas thiophila]
MSVDLPGGQLLPVRQLKVFFQFSFSVPVDFGAKLLIPWLERLDTGTGGGVHGDEIEGQTAELDWLRGCLSVAYALLHAVRMPVFDPPAILSGPLSTASGALSVRVALPLVDQMPRSVYDQALKLAFRLCDWAVRQTPDAANFARFDATCQKDFILPFSRLMPGKSTFYLLRTAYRLNIPFIHFGNGVFQLGWGNRARRIDRSITDADSFLGSKLAQDKAVTAGLLRLAGLPAAEHRQVVSEAAALDAARFLGWPVVVKPVDRDRGEAVTVNVTEEATLKDAFERALRSSRSRRVLVERCVAGVCHRLFVAHGRLLYAVKRLPLTVTGDGCSSIVELVQRRCEDEQRRASWLRSEIRPLDALARAAIQAAGYTETSIVPAGVLIPLRNIESTAFGGTNEDVTTLVHPENIRVALAATELFNLRVAGIDLMTTDIAVPWHENGAIINEVNFAPLLGARDVSAASLQPFLQDLLGGDGLIPVEVYVGGEAAFKAARARQLRLARGGRKCHLCSQDQVLTPEGTHWPLPLNSLYRRVRALVLSSEVEALVVVVHNDEFLTTGLPLESVRRVVWVDDALTCCDAAALSLAPGRSVELEQLMIGWGKRFQRQSDARRAD